MKIINFTQFNNAQKYISGEKHMQEGSRKDLSFGKIVRSEEVKIQKTNGKVENLNFVEYEPGDVYDKEQIEKLEQDWVFADYISSIASSFKWSSKFSSSEGQRKNYYYGLEDKDGKTLVITDTIHHTFPKDDIYISYLQAKPDEMYGSNKRHYKGLGATLISEIAKLAKEADKDYVSTTSTNDDFWDKMKYFENFSNHPADKGQLRLDKDNYDDYIAFVEGENLDTAGQRLDLGA